MTTFISRLAETINPSENIDYKDIAIILPNKRAQRKLFQEIASKIEKPIFPPAVLSVDEFIHSLSPLELMSQSELLVELYSIYSQFEYAKTHTLQDFLAWGKVILRDMNEIDMQLANAENIFSDLHNIKELESFGQDKLSIKQEEYLQFYQQLIDIYHQFRDSLNKKSKGYAGMIYRDVAENFNHYADQLPYKKYVFAGLNAISPSEMQIVENLYSRNNLQIEFLFDLDTFYYQENGKLSIHRFVEQLKNRLQLKEIKHIGNDYATIKKEVKIYGLTKQINQLYLAADLLHNQLSDKLEQTAIVFADESLIEPFVHIYDCKDANITMSYPITATKSYHLLQNMLALAKGWHRYQQTNTSAQDVTYYHKDITAFIKNPLIKNAFFQGKEADYEQYIHRFILKNQIFYKLSELRKIQMSESEISEFPEFPDMSPIGTVFIRNMSEFFKMVAENLDEGIEKSISASMQAAIDETAQILQSFPQSQSLDIPIIESFLKDRIHTLSLPFPGKNGSCLQVMGLLETRALDFKNVIMLSVNEGTIPAGKSDNSLLMFDVRCHYDLPTYKEKDDIYAYHFFRLLQRAENIYLLYNADSSDTVAEKSRFINQLQFEVKEQKLTNITISSEIVSIKPKGNAQNEVMISKTPEIIKKLTQCSYSPSQLLTYINCPLQFYLKYVAHIKKPQTINEDIEKNVIGTVTHKILEDLLNEIKNIPLDYKKSIEKLKKNIDHIVLETFGNQEEVKGQDLTRGKLYLATEVVKKYVLTYCKIVEKDLDTSQFEIIGTEVELTHKLSIDKQEFNLHGFCDRIDNRTGTPTLLDYKTGKVDTKELIFKDMNILFTNIAQKQLFQLMVYAYLYRNDHNMKDQLQSEPLCCGIVSFQEMLKNPDNNLIIPTIPSDNSLIYDDLINEFEENLKELLKEIVNHPEINHQKNDEKITDYQLRKEYFLQTDQTDHCKYCDYQLLCGRIVTNNW